MPLYHFLKYLISTKFYSVLEKNKTNMQLRIYSLTIYIENSKEYLFDFNLSQTEDKQNRQTFFMMVFSNIKIII